MCIIEEILIVMKEKINPAETNDNNNAASLKKWIAPEIIEIGRNAVNAKTVHYPYELGPPTSGPFPFS